MKKKFFERFSDRVVCITGSPGAFITASLLVVVWAVCVTLYTLIILDTTSLYFR
ncbi:hypothetical protein [Chryseobacterium sp. KLBC 52]|uniref:hypothetical protein n=1 Tax=Chryseobacterium sp. KLBC 52 TaxID=1862702 RepID=UPI001624EBFD|nr:hypothetical protein [Chryseobacterium sp. KLBC 52]